MREKIEKAKGYVKEHKKEIILVVAGTVIGVVGGLKISKIMDKNVIKIPWGSHGLEKAKSTIPSVMKDSRLVDFGYNLGMSVKDLGEYCNELLDVHPGRITQDTEINGILVMTK
jgi:hypothetical protein